MHRYRYYLLLVAQFLSLVGLGASLISNSTFYYLQIVLMSVLICFAYTGWYPFSRSGKIRSAFFWYLSCFFAALAVVVQGNSGEVLFWYPTSHPYWVFLPFALFGLICVKFNLGMEKASTDDE